MVNLKKLKKEITGLSTKLDFYQKMLKESLLLRVDNLIDFQNYLKEGE